MTKGDAGSIGEEFLQRSYDEFRRYKKMAEDVFEQLDDAELFFQPDSESLNIYLMVKHLAGNMRSRWVNFLTEDGEKPDRERDSEFEGEGNGTRAEMLALWEKGWGYLFSALDELNEDLLLNTVLIRAQPHTVVQAIQRQVGHYSYHVGQIVYIAKHLRRDAWKSLSIPKGRSEEFLRVDGGDGK